MKLQIGGIVNFKKIYQAKEGFTVSRDEIEGGAWPEFLSEGVRGGTCVTRSRMGGSCLWKKKRETRKKTKKGKDHREKYEGNRRSSLREAAQKKGIVYSAKKVEKKKKGQLQIEERVKLLRK